MKLRYLLFSLFVFIILLAGCSQQAQETPKKSEPEQKAPESQPPAPKIEPLQPEEKPQTEAKPEPVKNNTNSSIAPPPSKDPTSVNFNPAAFGNPHPKIKQGNYGECCNHPYWHKVYRAFSDNGITWQRENKLIKDHASVPEVLLKQNGTIILYYVDGEYDTMDCSISKDGGKTFNYGNCTVYGFTRRKIWDPEVVTLDNSFYRMYFYAPASGDPNESHDIISAVSKDGINWVQEDGVRVSYKGVYDPAAIRTDDGWRLYTWYSGGDDPRDAVIVISKSDDGLSFRKEEEVKVGGGIPDVQKLDSGNYRLYFCFSGISMAESDDGVNWGESRSVFYPTPGSGEGVICDPSIMRNQSKWTMYYKTTPLQH